MVKKNAELTKEKNLRAKVIAMSTTLFHISVVPFRTNNLFVMQAAKEAKASGKPVAANPMAKRASKVVKKAKK